MILIVGGSCQGKAAYARTFMEKERNPEKFVADGTKDCWIQAYDRPYLLNFHGFIRQMMEAEEDPVRFAEQICEKRPQLVTLDEVGSGIVPLNKNERDYREAVGEAGQLLAASAEEVYRMLCGIPMRIK